MATVFVLVCALAVSAAQSAEWIKVSPVGAGFSVLMPAKPEAEVKSTEDFTSHPVFNNDGQDYLSGGILRLRAEHQVVC